ncbi:MAG: S9 family peptidase, partial [Verrucomicrobiota bacterium]
MQFKSILITGLILVSTGSLFAEEKKPIEPDDYFSLTFPYTLKISPDGKQICYYELRWDKELDKRNNDLWLLDYKAGDVRRLTFNTADDGNQTFSPDGRYIYYTSKRELGQKDKAPYDQNKQVWRIDIGSGQLHQVTREKKGITDYELSADGKALYYTVSTETRDDPWEKLKKDYKLTYGHGITDHHQVWKLDLIHWRSEKLVDEKRSINFFSVSSDQSRIA